VLTLGPESFFVRLFRLPGSLRSRKGRNRDNGLLAIVGPLCVVMAPVFVVEMNVAVSGRWCACEI